MNYKTFKRSLTAAVIGAGLWYGAGLAGVESTPGRMLEDATRIGCIDSIVQDSENTTSIPGMTGKMLTYAGLTGMILSMIPRRRNPE